MVVRFFSFIQKSSLNFQDLNFVLSNTFLTLDLKPKCVLHILSKLGFALLGYVGVDICSCFNIRVTKPILNISDVPILVVENGGCAVSEVMKTHLFQPMVLENTLKTPRYAVRPTNRTIRVRKYIVGFVIRPTEGSAAPILFLLDPQQ